MRETSAAVPHRIILVDDHEVVRRGLRHALGSEASIEIVGEAGSVAEGRRVAHETRPDVAVLDVVLPDGDGLQLCRELVASGIDVACIMLTSYPEPRAMLSAALVGAAAYLPKDREAADLVSAIRSVASGTRLLDQDRISEILEQLADNPNEHPGFARLTDQEARVFELVGQGLSNRQIAGQLHLAERTVKNYVSRMLTKLDMDRRTEAAVLAARLAERRAQGHARNGSRRSGSDT